MVSIPTEPIGSIPRPPALIEAVAHRDHMDPALDALYDEAIKDTIERFEATGSPVITDGEQRKYHNFWTYCVHGLPNMAPDGFKIPFSAGHVRRMPRLTAGPFKYRVRADRYLDVAQRYAHRPIKQAVISPSALSLLYPAEGIPGYSRAEFIDDLLTEHETEVRSCLEKGAHKVQIDFTEGRLAIKIDPTGALLHSFIDLNNLALSRFSVAERARLGVHTCPGGDRDSTHSADVDYAELLPSLFQLNVGSFCVALAGERDRIRVLKIIRDHRKPDQRVFVGVVAPIDPHVETPEEVRDRVLEAAEYIPVDQLGTTDDCGFSPFSDDTSTSRDTAFAKIRARVLGTELAAQALGSEVMADPDEEERLLRSVALQNAQSILAARQRAEQELLHTKEALEARTAELAGSLARMRATLESTTDGILVADRAGNVTDFNENFVRLWRLPRGALEPEQHRRVFEVVSRQLRDPGRFLARVEEILRTAPAESYDLLELADGRVFERFSKLQVIDGRDVGRVWSTRDITERRRAEEERSRLLEAERATRLELERVGVMKDEFLATLSHELRTPLNAMLGWSEVLLEQEHDDAELKQGLETIHRNARAQAQLIEDLLDMNRIISGKVRLDVQRADPATIVDAAVDSARPSAEAKGIRLRKIIDPLAGPVSGDPNRLQQIVWNLISNAVKFTPRGGGVDVVLARVSSHVEITVHDSGIGIGAEFLPHVFERFRQADSSTTRRSGGLGLGLAIAKQLVELHGGTIRVESPGAGQGTTFVVSLPLQVVRDAPEREHPASPKAPPRGQSEIDLSGIKVLVIDDEPDGRELVRSVLARGKAQVITAASAAEGLELLQRERPDVVVSDIGMPEKDGYELVRELRRLPPSSGGRTPAIALTAFARSEDRTRAMLAGYQMHLAKPIEARELLATVRSLAGRADGAREGET